MQYILTSNVTYSLVGKSICFSVQKEHVVLTRCGTGHGIFTHSLLLSNDEQADILRVVPINISIACWNCSDSEMLFFFVFHLITKTYFDRLCRCS